MALTLFIVFLILKLTKVIDWSWIWVTCPLWIYFIYTFAIAIFATIFAFTIAIFESVGF
jgi:hypothetical protein